MGFWYYCFVGAATLALKIMWLDPLEKEYQKKIDNFFCRLDEDKKEPQLHESFTESFNESNREFKYYD